MSLMLSLPEDWDYTLKGLPLISVEGIDAIREAVRELECVGDISYVPENVTAKDSSRARNM